MSDNPANRITYADGSIEATVRRLLDMQRREDLWLNRLEKALGGELDPLPPLCGDWELLHLALDLMGVPEDNTAASDAIEVASETGKWPEWGMCRDCYVDLYRVMVIGHDDIEGFVKLVEAELIDARLENGWQGDDGLEFALYGDRPRPSQCPPKETKTTSEPL